MPGGWVVKNGGFQKNNAHSGSYGFFLKNNTSYYLYQPVTIPYTGLNNASAWIAQGGSGGKLGIRWKYEDGTQKKIYMNGPSKTEFGVDSSVTQAQLVTILYRVAGEPSVEDLKNPFEDVKSGQWYTDAIVWAASEGVVNGVSATEFASRQGDHP